VKSQLYYGVQLTTSATILGFVPDVYCQSEFLLLWQWFQTIVNFISKFQT